jgi:hypothetical protein
MLACWRAVQPPISQERCASEAFAIAVTVLVTPGPAVTIATPSAPLSSACAWAMWTAAPFVANVDYADSKARNVVPKRLDVAAL